MILKDMNKKQQRMLARIAVATVLVIALHFLPATGPLGTSSWARFVLYLVPYAVVGHDILRKACHGIVGGQVFDENFLMAVATVGAFAIALVQGTGDYVEAVAVMLFYQVGELFQSYAVGKSRRSIGELMDIRPDYANVEQGGALVRVDPDEVEVGTVIVVQPGEKIPIDGVIDEGTSSIDAMALTGESVPATVSAGDEVMSGCINLSGVLRVRTTQEFDESTASKIIELVEDSTSRKSRSENFISRFAKVYTPAVCVAALVLALVPPVVRLALGMDALWGSWVYRALTFLVISCPCALVISIPLTFFAGIGGASRAGVLVKGSNYLEDLSKTATVAFDKTGTMTRGVFEVNAIHHGTLPDLRLLEYAAHAECASSHPIAKSIRNAYLTWDAEKPEGTAPAAAGAAEQSAGAALADAAETPTASAAAAIPAAVPARAVTRDRVRDIEEVGGDGIAATVDDVRVAVGSGHLMERLGVPYTPCHEVGTVVHVALDGAYAGHILISDMVKPTARAAVAALHEVGVERTVMLTGDARRVGEAVGRDLGIDEVHAELLPADKVSAVEGLLGSCREGGKVAFVGDGINDAPVLGRADIGIAMGALGSDAAIEAADVVLMDDDPLKIARAIRISRRCMRIVYENIYFAIGVKLACLLLGAFGIANMWYAIFADVGVMVLAVLNAIRAMRV